MLAAIRRWGHEESVEGPEGDELAEQYFAWQSATELEYMNEIGSAGFEMVSMTREVQREQRHPDYVLHFAFPVVRVHCSFKRPKSPDSPGPPTRQIGFRIGQPITKEISSPAGESRDQQLDPPTPR
jgi:hypothetical protein